MSLNFAGVIVSSAFWLLKGLNYVKAYKIQKSNIGVQWRPGPAQTYDVTSKSCILPILFYSIP